VVKVRAGTETLTLTEAQGWCVTHGLASYKKPLSVEVVASVPLTAAGKVNRRAVRERYWAGHDRRVN
jgi:acyl-CoA synthetase (AMP-forming)/AMP-acid ligase II